MVSIRLFRRISAALLLLFLLSAEPCPGQVERSPAAPAPAVELQGEVGASQNHTYIRAPFHVPAGVHRVTLTFTYTERQQHTALDIGVLDPMELRCWSGGNKSVLTIGISDATPSCLPGPIPAGEWYLLIGVPNIRPGVRSHYTAQIFFTRTGLVADEPAVLRRPLRSGPAWYRGDLHMHTAHSDGQCPSQTGKMVPCPVFFTVEDAARRGLDFIAITDHNATSQYNVMRELQPYFDKVLLIPGREITTFQGHLNFLGTTQYLNFQLGSSAVPSMNVLLGRARKLGALVSINHPAAPSGEICMGCGWTPSSPVDMGLLTAVEAVNGGEPLPAFSSIPFWEQQLNRGYRLTAIGGSDNHRPMTPLDQPGAVGSPTTVIYARNLSTPAILDGIRSGRVFIDLTGSRDRMLDLHAQAAGSDTAMGGMLTAPAGARISIAASVAACPGATVSLVLDGAASPALAAQPVTATDQTLHWKWRTDGKRHWLLAEVRDASGQILLLGNPVYINWPANPPR
ncbi:MAG: CehA/McbA family metallohydrolase [Acidobacteriota bacterium]